MSKLKDDSGAVLVFVTLVMVLLMIMVGMGLDTGVLTFSRSTGQRAVDMAALAGVAGVAKRDVATIKSNIEQLNASNDYVNRAMTKNEIDGTVNATTGLGKNVTLIRYDFKTNSIAQAPAPLTTANGIRVALETTNPYTGSASNSAVNTPSFMMPLLNLLGAATVASNNINVSAVAVISAIPALPIALGGCNPAWEGQDAAPIPLRQVSSGDSSAIGSENSGWTTYLEPATSTPRIRDLIRQVANCQGTGGVGVGTPICLGNGQNMPVVSDFSQLVDPTGQTCYLAPVVDDDARFNQCVNPIRAFASICPRAICRQGRGNSYDPAGLCGDDTPASIIARVHSCNADPHTAVSQCYSFRLVREPQTGM